MGVKIIKMVSGDEVLAKEETGEYVFSKPRVMQVMQSQTGEVRAGLVPWIIASPDSSVTVNKTAIAAILDAPLDVEKSYLSSTSGIALS